MEDHFMSDQEFIAAPEGYFNHEERWHEASYACGQCGANFAAAPALERHARESGHSTEWVCHDEECEMTGVSFTSRTKYVDHIRESPAHRNGNVVDDILSSLGTLNVTPSPGEEQPPDSTHSSPTHPHIVSSDLYVCREPCCPRFGTDYRCRSEYDRHASVVYHLDAADINKTLLARMQPGPALVAEQEAIRNLRCNAPTCFYHGESFNTAKGFFGHLQGDEHREAWRKEFGDTLLPENDEAPTLPGMEIDSDENVGTCVNPKCPKVGAKFDTFQKMRQHAHSFAHAMTEEDMVSSDGTEEEVWKSCDMDGMEVTGDGSLWRCVKRGCKWFGKTINMLGNAKKHSNGAKHTKADQNRGMFLVDLTSPVTTPRVTTPKATPMSAPGSNPFSPIEIPDGMVPVTPQSPCAGRGPGAIRNAMTSPRKPLPASGQTPTSRKSLPGQRPKATVGLVQRRQDELEARNQQLEERVKNLEEQLERVLSANTANAVEELPSPQRVVALSQFVRARFRPPNNGDDEL
ncbi:hypothetical protein FALBO_6456 [Fusarium albosuccineum]|uniref:C2H2-type domain-containing protein n=1 Tax=Fusarium albosuccineum TaxID=1237068 RepID=A0A8H4PEL1_9HYPO|nr:hypothetical protein FALBO_6456 [Fusarium albosuccineum]